MNMNQNVKQIVEPTVLVIFGATGDLAQNKLYPALFDLFTKNLLPKKILILAFARRDFSDEAYQELVRAAVIAKKNNPDPDRLGAFLSSIKYVRGTFEDDGSYGLLAKVLADTDKEFNVCSNKLFYLAVPPFLYENILNRLSKSGLTIPCGGDGGWTRVLVEKPFGTNSEAARRLDRLLGKLFNETQIFRIDHYLAKEAIQNILVFRFSNALFEPIWNRKHIERIEIRMFEKDVVGSRGAFYDPLGALRDVGQNHLLAMLSLVAMEYPRGFTAPGIQKERAKVLRQLVPINAISVRKIIKGQYTGYREEKGVAPQSNTETFFSLTAYSRNSRFKGVPIELTAGKALGESKTEIHIHFKDVNMGKGDIKCHRNTLTFRIQPNESISVLFWVKKPGFDNRTAQAQTLSFNYSDSSDTNMLPDAYERVLYDCVRGDQTLFASTEEMEAAWKFITPILETWGKNPLKIYAPGTPFEEIISNHT